MDILITSPAGITVTDWPTGITFTHLAYDTAIERHLASNPTIDVLVVVTAFVVDQYDCLSIIERAMNLDPAPPVLLVRTREHESSLAFICDVRDRYLNVTEVAVAPLYETHQPELQAAGPKKSRGEQISPQWEAIVDIAIRMGNGQPAPRDARSFSSDMTKLLRSFRSLPQTYQRALVRAADARTVPRTNKAMARALGVGMKSYNNDVRDVFSKLGISTDLKGPIALVDVAGPIREWLLSYGRRMSWYPAED